MKKIIFSVILIISFLRGFNQTINNTTVGRYFWNNTVTLTSCNNSGKVTNSNDSNTPELHFSEPDQVFDLLYTLTEGTIEYSIIRILTYDKTKSPSQFYDFNFNGTEDQYKEYKSKYPNTSTYGTYQRFFRIKTDDLLKNATKYSYTGGGLAGGILNFPFKLRLQKDASDFSSAFNLGAAVGYTFGHYDYRSFTWSALAAAGITSINLDASTIKSTGNADQLQKSNNFSALTAAVGLMTQYDKFQAGIFLGFDRLGKINNDTFDWRYQNKPWISIGFGYSIFTVQKEKTDGNTKQKE